MAILKAGTSNATFGAFGVIAGSGRHSPDVQEGFYLPSDAIISNGDFDPQEEIWLTYYYSTNAIFTNTPFAFGKNGSTRFRCRTISSDARLEYWDGSSWVLAATFSQTLPSGISNSYRLDVQLKMHAIDGCFRVWRDKVLVADYTGNTLLTSITDIDTVFLGRFDGGSCVASAIIIANEDTRPLRYAQLLPSGAGSVNQWTGDGANVSGSTGYSDASIVSTDENDRTVLFDLPSLPAEFNSGWTVEAVAASARLGAEAGKSSAARLVARSGGVDAFGPDEQLLPIIGAKQHLFLVDPATGLPWDIAGVNAMEVGVQSRAPT